MNADEKLALEITKAIVDFNSANTIAEKTKLFTETFLEVLENVKNNKYGTPEIRTL